MIDLQAYQRLNNSFRNELIFHIGATSGFYSEFNNMVLAMIYCLQCRIKFRLYSEDANFKYEKGWNDYFLPFCEEVKGGFYHKYNLRTEDPMFEMRGFFERFRFSIYRLMHRHTYLTFDLFHRFRIVSFERTRFTIPELGVINADLRTIARDIINMIYRFQPEVEREISEKIKCLGLPEQYIGFHIRGGDKCIEIKLADYNEYIKKAEKMSSIRTAFIATDEYLYVDSLSKNYPDWTFYTLTEPDETGFYYEKYNSLKPSEKRQDLIKLFATMEILRKSQLFIGMFSSNPGMFLGMSMENAYGVDFDHWLVW